MNNNGPKTDPETDQNFAKKMIMIYIRGLAHIELLVKYDLKVVSKEVSMQKFSIFGSTKS